MDRKASATNVIITCSQEYQSPEVEMVEIAVEQGFAATESDGTIKDMPWG